MLPLGRCDDLDSLGILDNQAVQDNQAGKEIVQGNQAELGIQVACLMQLLQGLEGRSLVGHLYRVVEDLGMLLVVVASHNPAQGEGTGVVLMHLQDQGMVGVDMEEAWNLRRGCSKIQHSTHEIIGQFLY